jgi:hypothetical protein
LILEIDYCVFVTDVRGIELLRKTVTNTRNLFTSNKDSRSAVTVEIHHCVSNGVSHGVMGDLDA